MKGFRLFSCDYYPVLEGLDSRTLELVTLSIRAVWRKVAAIFGQGAFPPELWKKIRTTNVLERTFREYRRRTRPMQLFPNPESAERIYYGVTDYLNQNWEEHPR
jgi:transposase-like protein